jgi:hypothetical protein
LVDDTRHFEQAVWAEGLSEQSLAELRPLVAAQWRTLVAAMVPALQAAVDADAARTAAGDAPARGRFRLGLYEFTENQVDASGSDADGDPS